MSEENKRRHPRIHSLNLSHLATEQGYSPALQGMGRTRNLSESGVLLETTFEVPLGPRLVITLGLEDELIELTGRAMYCKTRVEGKFETGIAFENVTPDTHPKLKWFILVLGNKGNADA